MFGRSRHRVRKARERRGLGGSVYEGPLDLVPGAVAAYSVRALGSAWLGQPLFTLQKMDGGAEPSEEFDADAVTGEAPLAAIATFLGADDGALKIWNDQSGNSLNMLSPDRTAIFGASVFGSKPGFESSISTSFETNVETTAFPNGEATIFLVANLKAAVGGVLSGQGNVLMTTTDDPSIDMASQDGRWAGGDIVAPASGTYLWDAAWKFGAKNFRVNGSTQAFDSNFDDIGDVSAMLLELEIHWVDQGVLTEWLIFNTLLSDADRLLIRQNIAAYYGITLS